MAQMDQGQPDNHDSDEAQRCEDQLLTLLKDFCVLNNIEDEESIIDEAPIEIDGIEFYLSYRPDVMQDALFVTCDLGEVQKNKVLDVYRALLEQNFMFYTGNGPTFGIAPDTGHITFVDHYRLAELTPENLRLRLSDLAAKTIAWQASHGVVVARRSSPMAKVLLQKTLVKR